MKEARRNKTYYKVVSGDGGRFWSAVVPKRLDGRVEYFTSKWAQPKKGNGPLAVFRCFATACAYATSMPVSEHDLEELVIFACNIVTSKKRTVWVDNYMSQKLANLPVGTVLAKKVKLTGKAIRRFPVQNVLFGVIP